jgi:hydrogenase maturation protease
VTATEQAGKGTLLLGLGNDILTDDAIGLLIASALESDLAGRGIHVRQSAEMGLALLDLIAGYRIVVVLDAIQTKRAPAGFIHELDADNLKVLPAISPHFLGVGEMLALGRQLGLSMPSRLKILAVEVNDPFTVGVTLTQQLREALPVLIERVRTIVIALAQDD